ncbi:MAG: hypothetical protein N3A64_02310 [Desulfobacterota bacterium]|nr:hypothetical protein [Thermodesulfobacteriota bacterium]
MSIKIFKGVLASYHMGKIFGQKELKGIERIVFLENNYLPGKSFHIAAHVIDYTYKHQRYWHYSQLHVHGHDEINILISLGSTLQYRIEFDGNIKEVFSPVSIYIPAGIKHRSEPVAGTGIFICIYLDQLSSTST